MAHLYGKGVTRVETWMRMCTHVVFAHFHPIPPHLAQTKEPLQDPVPRHPQLAQLAQHHPHGLQHQAGLGRGSKPGWVQEGLPTATQELSQNPKMPALCCPAPSQQHQGIWLGVGSSWEEEACTQPRCLRVLRA